MSETITVYDQIEIEDFVFDPTQQIFTYPCPCGDRFQIAIDDMLDGEDIAVCPSCSLMVRIIFDQEDLDEYREGSSTLCATGVATCPFGCSGAWYVLYSCTRSGNTWAKLASARLYALDFNANSRLVRSEVTTLPVVCSSPVINDSSPVTIVDTDHDGFHESSWKSLMLKQIRVFTWNRPDGVIILIAGGLNGYSGGNTTRPWYCPFSYGVPGGPVIT